MNNGFKFLAVEQKDSLLHVLLSHLQSLYQRRSPASYIQVVRDA